jgi:hypothetical protein
MGEKCVRCNKAEVTNKYPCASNWPTKKEPVKGENKEKIQTCNGCTSPKSRLRLHEKNAFSRYEHQFLNLIVKDYVKNENYTVMLNLRNESDSTRYDALIETIGTEAKSKNSIMIEIDELGHYTTPEYFEKDRKKEKNYFTQRKNYNKTSFIHIRVGENLPGACVSKNSENCSVNNQKLFDKNMKNVDKFIKKSLGDSKITIKNAYIDFSTDEDVKDYPFKNIEQSKKYTKERKEN